MPKISIAGVDKVDLLVELYNNTIVAPAARQFGSAGPDRIDRNWLVRSLPHHQFGPTVVEAYHDYLFGHMIKTDLRTSEVDTWGFDRDNGAGAFERCLARVRARQ